MDEDDSVRLILPSDYASLLSDPVRTIELHALTSSVVRRFCFAFDNAAQEQNCHSVAIALAQHFQLYVRHGYFAASNASVIFGRKNYHHSWLEIPWESGWIIDSLPWFTLLSPLLVYMGKDGPWHGLYVVSECDDDSLKAAVEDAKKLAQKLLQTLDGSM